MSRRPCLKPSQSFEPFLANGVPRRSRTWTSSDTGAAVVVIDATMLLLFVRPDIASPKGVPEARKRIEFRIAELDRARARIVIPTPVLSEALVKAGSAERYKILDVINRKSVFRNRTLRPEGSN